MYGLLFNNIYLIAILDRSMITFSSLVSKKCIWNNIAKNKGSNGLCLLLSVFETL